ncbi:MAG: hypothetical protein AAF170_03085 [Bacteroidota bacterium]
MRLLHSSFPVGALIALSLAVLTSPARAQAETPEVLPTACEVELALSAAPPHLREGAGVFVYTAEGYVQHREATNPYTCIVNRDSPRNIKPTCFDAEGTATIIPKIEFVGERLARGIPMSETWAAVQEGFEDGTFASPTPGLAYMLSNYNRPFNTQTDSLVWFPPHVMVYAPNLTNEAIGTDMDALNADWRLPFVGYQGPQGFVIVLTQEQSTPQPGDLPHCPAWLRANPPEVAESLH